MSTYAVVPVKTLLKSKMRLSSIFTPRERSQLTLAMLEDVLKTLKASEVDRTIIVSSDPAVEGLVADFGMTFLKETEEGLNQAANQATGWCIKNKAQAVLTLLADVPLITTKDVNMLVRLAKDSSIVISPSRNGGTNALLQTPPGVVSFCFGLDSFKKHVGNALAKCVRPKIYVSSSVMLDIDSEKDLEWLLKLGG